MLTIYNLEQIVKRYSKVYLLGAASRTSVALQKEFRERGYSFEQIWDEKNMVNNATKDILDSLGKLSEGIVIVAIEMRYQLIWLDRCKEVLNIDFADGYEVLYSEVYKECNRQECDLLQCRSCEASYHSCPNRRQYYERKGAIRKKVLRHVALKVGFICNLKCKYCCEFLPYFNKSHVVPFNLDQYIDDIKKLSSAVEYINTFSFSGGDVMLNPGLAFLIDYVVTLDNIGDIYILTNGTYVPCEQILAALERNKSRIRVVANDYEVNRGALPLISELKKRGVQVKVRPNEGWYDFTDLSYKNRTKDELKELYSRCSFDWKDNSYYIYCNGVINMRCGVANGILHYLNLYNECKDDYVNIRDISVDSIAGEIDRIEKKGYVGMCNYCRGCDLLERNIKPADFQIKKEM